MMNVYGDGYRVTRPRQAAFALYRFVCGASLAVVGLLPPGTGHAQGQKPGAGAPAFDVVSVKPSESATVKHEAARAGGPPPPRSAISVFRYSPARVSCNNSLAVFLQEAYQVAAWQISGPDWLAVDAFDFQATMPTGTGKETARLMLRTMLADRFGLKFHTEQKDVPVYALVAAKGGFKLTEVENLAGYSSKVSPGRYSCDRVTMPAFALFLNSRANRPVLDMTGLTGAYKIELRWTYQEGDDALRDPGVLGALDQVGLRLEPRKMPYPILTIDHVERKPTPN